MNENTSTCVKCGYTLAQHDYVHGARGNCGNFVDAGPFFDDRPLLDMNDITQLSTLYSNAIARAEKAEEALRGWQPIGTAPKDGTVVDLWHKNGFRITDQWWLDDEEECWTCLFSDEEFTHWAPIFTPPPPVRETP